MALEDYKIPSTLEEVTKRKEELADIIAKYNEAEFNGGEYPCTEAELDDYMEEYEILQSRCKLSKEEKQKLKAEYDNEGNEIIDEGFFTKVKVIPSLIMAIIVILSCFACILGNAICNAAMDSIIDTAFQNGITDGLESLIGTQYEISGFKYFFTLSISFFGPALVVTILAIVIFIIFKKGTKENKKFLLILMIAAISIAMISSLIYFFVSVLPDAIEVFDVLDDNYYYTYLYNLYQQYYSSYGY